MQQKDVILTINGVEPGLVRAVQMHAHEFKKPLEGVVLVDREYASRNPKRPRDESGVFKEIVCDFDDLDALQKTLKPYLHRILAVTCRFENAIERLRQIIPFVPYVNAPSESALLWSTEKPLMRDRLRAYNPKLVPRYQYVGVSDLERIEELIEDFTFPVIVKPSGLAASLLVTECKNMSELKDDLDNAFKVIKTIYKRNHRHTEPSVLVEEMMVGDMYSVDAYVSPTGEVHCLPLVKVITAHSIGLPGFYSYRHIVPVDLSEKQIKAAFEAATEAVHALNLSSTSTHIELFLTKEGWKLIEVGARIGGYREDLYFEAYGVDHYYNDLAVRMGKAPKMPGAPLKHAAGFNMYADEEGEIVAIEGMEEASKLASMVQIEAHAKPGDLALFAAAGGNLVVDGILSNEDPAQLEADVLKMRQIVKIVTKPLPSYAAYNEKSIEEPALI